jgi:Tfp pilus assembly protein PilZ
MNPRETKAFSPTGAVEEQTKTLSETLPAHSLSANRSLPEAKRRAFARRKGKGKVTYQIGDSPMASSHKATLVDISENGIGLVTDKQLEVGTLLRISLETPHRGQHVTMAGQVRWVTVMAEKQFRVGCNLERRLQYTDMQNFAR